MTSTRRVLMFAPYFLPRRRVGSMRPFRFVIHLREFGWTPTVLTIAARGQHLTPKEEQLLSGIEIIELRSPLDRTTSSESQLGTESTSDATSGTDHRSFSIGRTRPSFIDGAISTLDRQFPADTWLLLFGARYRTMMQIVRRIKPDVIWCTGDPWSALVAARGLAEHFDIPWVADFRDPWTLSEIRSEGQWALTRRADAYLERKIIESADLVMFQAASVEEAYREHYNRVNLRTRVIYNSFDPNVFDDPVIGESSTARAASEADGLHIGFFGRFRSMSPASVLINALSAIRRRSPDRAARFHVHSFGKLNESDKAYAAERGVLDAFVREEAVPLEKSLSALRRFDLLLVSTDLTRDRIIPAKIFEYLAAGRPILSLSRNPEVSAILEETNTGVQLDPLSPEKVADFLLDCLQAADEGRPMPIRFAPNTAAISRFDARETTRDLARTFDEITGGRSTKPRADVRRQHGRNGC